MTTERATLDEEFERDVIAKCLRDSSFLRDAAPVLEAHHLGSKHLSWVWGVIRESWTKFSETPTTKTISARAARDFPDEDKRLPYLRAVADLMRKEATAPRLALEEIRRFVRMAHLHDAMVTAAKSLGESDPDAAEDAVRKALLAVPRARAYDVVRWMEEFDARQAERRHRAESPESRRVIPTGIRPLDRILGGGVEPEEVGIVMATTSRGKSMFLNNVGWHAIARGHRVVHFTTEMRASQVAQRYDSRFTLVEYEKFKRWTFSPEEMRHIGDRVERWRERLNQKLRIVAIPMRRADTVVLRQAIDDVASDMGGVDEIIVDSADHMVSTMRHREIRLDQAEVYWDLKNLAQELHVAAWSSTQAGREWEDRIAKAEAASESYDKSRIADIIVTLNSPSAGRRRKGAEADDDADGADDKAADERAVPKLELFLAKYRDGASRISIPLEADLARMLMKAADEGE